ncbi:MAG: hypothetical protein ACKVP0_16260 [Pirellulaceae bacterium]
MRSLAPLSLALIAGLLPSLSALGQNLEREQLNVAGTLKGVAPGAIQVEVSEKEVWILKVEAKPEDVTFSGTAEKSFLQPGMFLEFRSPVNKRGMVLEPVANLIVFTPSEARLPGVQADGDLGGGAPVFKEEKGEKKPDPKEKKAAKPKADDTVYLVRGAITKVGRGGDITVSADGAQVKFNLAEDCKISVEVNELSFVAPGDKVTVQGWYIKDQPGEGAASKIEVSAAKPLTSGVKKKPTKPVKETKTPAKGAKGVKGEKGDKEEKPAEENKDEPKKGDKKGTEKPEPKKDE